MADYRCPAEIAENFATESLAREKGREQYVEWLRKLKPKLQAGDRIEAFGENNDPEWWVYEPTNN